MRDWVPVAVIAGIFFFLCLAFNQATPYRKSGVLLHQQKDGMPLPIPDVGAPDERQHANYVKHILNGKGIPVFNPKDENLFESYQSHQPPAYYLLAAAWCKVAGIDPTDSETGKALRVLNAFIGVATVIGLCCGARWTMGEWKFGWAACTFALIPMNVALNSSVSNDPMLICLCTWVLALLGLAISLGWTLRIAVIVALLSFLAFMTKTTAIALVPCLLLSIADFKRSSDTKTSNLIKALVVLAPLLLAAPWWIRNTSLYGDPLALTAFKNAFVGSPQASDFMAILGPSGYWFGMVAWWTTRSMVGVFGYMDVFMFESMGMSKSGSLYLALLFIGAIPVVVGVASLLRSPEEGVEKGTKLIWAVFSILVVLLFVRFNMQYFQGQARYLYPALGPVAWCAAAGACRLLKSKPTLAWIPLGAGLALLDIVAYNDLTTGFVRRMPLGG